MLGLTAFHLGRAEEPTSAGLPILRSGCEVDYPPFCLVGGDGTADGFSVELMQAAVRAMGHTVSFPTAPWAEVKGWLERGEVQALPLVGRTPEREAVFDFSFPYLTLHGALVVRRDAEPIWTLDDLKGRRVATMRGDNAEEFLRRTNREFQIVTTATFEDALQDLAAGGVDGVVMPRLVALRLIHKGWTDTLRISADPVVGFQQEFCFAVREGDRETLALLNEGLAYVMADGTFRRLHAKWFAALELPGRRLVIGGDANFPPYEFLDGQGRPSGFCTELTRAIASELELDVEIRLGNFARLRELLKRGEIDAMQGVLYSPERVQEFDFSPPHSVISCLAVVRQGAMAPPSTPVELEGKRLVVEAGDRLHDYALKHGLTNHLTTVVSQEVALREVAEGRQDCALACRMPALYFIERRGWTNLALANSPLFTDEYCYAVPKGHSALLAQLSEGVNLLAARGEHRKIHDKWLGPYRHSPPSWRLVLRYLAMVVVPLMGVLGISLFWSWTLRRKVAVQTRELRAMVKENQDARHALLGLLEDQQRTEQESMRMSVRFKALIENAPDGIVLVDQAGQMVFASPSARRMFGFGMDDDLSRLELNGFTHPEDLPTVLKTLGDLRQNPGPVHTLEYRFRHHDGAWIWVESVFSNLLGVPGIEAIVINFRNITDRKRAEERQDSLQAQLQQAQKLESVGRLAGGVAHDFNNMLQSILGHVELMQMKGLPSPDLRMDLEEIRKAAQRSADLTRQLLGFARKQTIMPKIIDINQTVDGLLTMMRRLLGEDIELVWKPGAERMLVKIDPTQIDQILVNLALNARDALNGTGRILLETQRGRPPVETSGVGVAGTPGGDFVLLRITDNGCGMSPEVQAQILEPFFTTKPLGKGTGLGLPMVYGMVKQNQGELTFISEVGKGSVFTVYLPLVLPEPAEHSAAVRQTDLPGGRERVLVVEDEPSIRVTLVRFLESLGYTAWSADNPEQALAMLRNPGLGIALLITDVVMPGLSGGELVSKARALRPGLKCLHISGYPDDDLSRRGIVDKKVPFLPKPFTRDQLAHKVREALGG